MSRCRRRTASLYLRIIPLLFTCGLFGQTPDTATILGTVTDPSHAVVALAQVDVSNQQSGLKRTTHSDVLGRFSIAGLPVSGNYTLTATKQGFSAATVNDVALAAGR